ncbi:hypothetical protein [Neptuniibacter pectenicola]|nr:hypothetical protein [Neptuniibacter pectenicola]
MDEKLLNQIYQGELKGPDIHVVEFDQLAEALREFKRNRKALKYTIEVA